MAESYSMDEEFSTEKFNERENALFRQSRYLLDKINKSRQQEEYVQQQTENFQTIDPAAIGIGATATTDDHQSDQCFITQMTFQEEMPSLSPSMAAPNISDISPPSIANDKQVDDDEILIECI